MQEILPTPRGDLAEDIDTVRPSLQSSEIVELEQSLHHNKKGYDETVDLEAVTEKGVRSGLIGPCNR